MKKLLIIAALLLTGCSAIQDPYVKVGAGYKFRETNITFNSKKADDPISARLEIGAQCLMINVTCGVTHRSQWLTGAPFNDEKEYGVTEFFVEYTYRFGR